jgi:purine-binding chemotaxis protein CheW
MAMDSTTVRNCERSTVLVVKVGARACAIPLRYLAETMRPLVIEPVPGVPGFVAGVSVIRGIPTPVVDLRALIESSERSAIFGRFVTLKVGGRQVAIAVDSAVGLMDLDSAEPGELPPMLRDADARLIEAIATRDGQLLMVLRATSIVPDEVWTAHMAAPAMR